jgi:hypothetical protein
MLLTLSVHPSSHQLLNQKSLRVPQLERASVLTTSPASHNSLYVHASMYKREELFLEEALNSKSSVFFPKLLSSDA